jgi:hypothetical protein
VALFTRDEFEAAAHRAAARRNEAPSSALDADAIDAALRDVFRGPAPAAERARVLTFFAGALEAGGRVELEDFLAGLDELAGGTPSLLEPPALGMTIAASLSRGKAEDLAASGVLGASAALREAAAAAASGELSGTAMAKSLAAPSPLAAPPAATYESNWIMHAHRRRGVTPVAGPADL